jgi:hypothetical protein
MQFEGQFMGPSVGALAVFSYLAVATWSDNRRREREAYYRHDTLRKIAEAQGGAAAALEYLRADEKNAQRRRQEGLKLGGLITTAAGVGLFAFLIAIRPDRPYYVLSLIPLLIGLALLLYAYMLAPKV